MSDSPLTMPARRRPRRPDTHPVALADSVVTASRAYKDLVHALADRVVEYHAWRHGVEIVSHVNYSLQRRVQRQRQDPGAPSRSRR